MITVISGGSGTLKLIRALRRLIDDSEIAVVANTSDAIWIDGTLASPDIDDTIFLFSGILNPKRWHGIKGDTFSTCSFYNRYFDGDGTVATGDKERAVHIARGRFISEGLTPTRAAKEISGKFGICSPIIPATDNSTELSCTVGGEVISPAVFRQNFGGAELDLIEEAKLAYFNEPVLTPEASGIIRNSDAVIIGPGSPITSIMPQFACSGIKEALSGVYTIAFAPRFPNSAAGFSISNYEKIIDIYRKYSDLIVQNSAEEQEIDGAMRLDTTMRSGHSAESLAWDIMSVVRSPGQ